MGVRLRFQVLIRSAYKHGRHAVAGRAVPGEVTFGSRIAYASSESRHMASLGIAGRQPRFSRAAKTGKMQK
jgi:hypothetical protein